MELFSWGSNAFGQLGLEKVEVDLEEDEYLSPSSGVKIKGSTAHIEAVACGWNHTLFQMDDGLVYSCGLNSHGQLGYDSDSNVYSPKQIKSLEAQKILHVACGENFTVVVNNKGQAFSCGSNEHGQLGVGTKETYHAIPRQIKGIPSGISIASVSCGKEHTVALSTGGHVFTWGRNVYGQLGVGLKDKEIFHASRVNVLSSYPIAQVAAGGDHTFALTISGVMFAWGKNTSGQLGLGHTESSCLPVKVECFCALSQRVKFICCGEDHTAVLNSSGNLFTFGCSKSGQLGHNSFSDELNLRLVNALIGTVITQVACGRKHTLCYSSASGDMFAFGLNVKGQLGINSYQKQNIPVKVSAFWSSIPEELSNGSRKDLQKYENIYFKRPVGDLLDHGIPIENKTDLPILHQIFCGGLQSYVTAFRLKCPAVHVNRLLTRSESLFYLTRDICEDMVSNATVQNKQSLLLLSTIFSNVSCLNASFLDSETYESSFRLKRHGLRLMAVHRSSTLLFGNTSFESVIIRSLKQILLPSLNNLQSDKECLRVFIILPEVLNCHTSTNEWEMAHSLSETILNLNHSAASTLSSWWSEFPVTFFERLLQCFKRGLTNLLPHVKQALNPTSMNALDAFLKMMKKLFQINEAMGDIVVHSAFYVHEISTNIDIKSDFVQWIEHPENFSFCKFPFIFGTKEKALIMEVDAELQMQIIMCNTQMRNIAGFVRGNVQVPSNPFLVLEIRRDCIVQDTLNGILAQRLNDLKKPLRIKFQNEDGEDAGGVRKEFFLLLMKEILDPRYGMFDFFKDSGTMWFKPGSFESPHMFLLIGVLCGLAIYNSVIIDLPFSITLYRKLLNKKTSLNDLVEIQPDVARSLQYILDYTADDFEETFNLSFQVTEQVFGEIQTIDLEENGSNIVVTQENKEKYVELYVNHKIHKSVAQEFNAFSDGFHRVCGGNVLRFFHPQELMDLIVGCHDYQFSDLEKIAEYKGEYHRNHPVISYFWNTFYSFNIDMKKKFLAFLTGTNKVSIHGMRHMKFIIQPMLAESCQDYLPVAHTCFNILDLPKYLTLEKMKQKLSQAIENSEGFGLV